MSGALDDVEGYVAGLVDELLAESAPSVRVIRDEQDLAAGVVRFEVGPWPAIARAMLLEEHFEKMRAHYRELARL